MLSKIDRPMLLILPKSSQSGLEMVETQTVAKNHVCIDNSLIFRCIYNGNIFWCNYINNNVYTYVRTLHLKLPRI